MPKLCQQFLRAAATKIRKAGLARGTRLDDDTGAVCLLGALDYCGVTVPYDERRHIEAHLRSLLPLRPEGAEGYDTYNGDYRSAASDLAWWSNMIAKDAEEVAQKFDEAAESC